MCYFDCDKVAHTHLNELATGAWSSVDQLLLLGLALRPLLLLPMSMQALNLLLLLEPGPPADRQRHAQHKDANGNLETKISFSRTLIC